MRVRKPVPPLLLVALGLALAGCMDGTFAPAAETLHSATLTWNASTSPVSVYRIYRSTNPDAEPELLAVTPGNVTRYVDQAVEPGATYYYSVKAIGTDGAESELSARISATIPTN
jgi:fibronectin type 3 domain-containing protein